MRREIGHNAFLRFSDQERGIILENILSFRQTIPSLYTFFQDVRFLQACADSVKWLVKVTPGQSLYAALEECYTGTDETQYIQTTENTCYQRHGSQEYCKRLGYLGLITFAMRHHDRLPKQLMKTDVSTIPRAHADKEILKRFASLAAQLGFDTPEIRDLKGAPDVLSISDSVTPPPLLVTAGPGEALKHRRGFPHVDRFEADRISLFLPSLCSDTVETGEGIASFFVLRTWFAAFFNSPRWSLTSMLERLPSPEVELPDPDRADVDMGGELVGGLDLEGSGQQSPMAGISQSEAGVGLEVMIRSNVDDASILGQEEDPLFGTCPTCRS